MKTLVLDKSALIGASRYGIKKLRERFDFLLTDTLLHEIATEGFKEHGKLCEKKQKKLDQRIDATFAKTVRDLGNSWIEMNVSIRWEIENGRSAKFGPIFSTEDIRITDYLSPKVLKLSAEYEGRIGNLTGMKHHPEDEDDFQVVRRMSEREVLEKMEHDFAREQAICDIAEDARRSFVESARERGWSVSSYYKLDRGWLSFGMYLVHRGYVPWKFNKYGDEPAQPKKPANPSFDLIYIGHMAIADGILSTDKEQLKLAWAIWPEKRENIYYYDQATHEPEVFEPEWKL